MILNAAKTVRNAIKHEGHTAKEIGASGVRNLIPYPYYETTHTESGVDWTDNGDGTVTANGTATANTMLYCSKPITYLKDGETYTLSGCPKGGGSSTYCLRIATSSQTLASDYGDGTTFTYDSSLGAINLYARVTNGATVENLTFKPMLELGSIAHDYVPYHFGGAEDALTLGGLTAEEFVSNDNLLVNPYFLDPVNSSGVTTITGTGASNKNFIDGWQVYANSNINTFEVTDNGIKLTNHGTTNARLWQKYSIDLTDQVVTLSLSITELTGSLDIYSSKDNASHSLKASISTTGVHSITFNMGDKNQLTMQTSNVTGDTATIEWAKLELGSIATPLIPPNKEVEKLKCGIVDNAKAVNGMEVYTTLAQIGLSGVVTMADAFNAMPNTSQLFLVNNNTLDNYISDAPTTYTFLILTKRGSVYGEATATQMIGSATSTAKSNFWKGSWHNTGGWRGWDDLSDADTVDGYHASEFIKTSGGTIESESFGMLALKRNGEATAAIRFENDNGVLGYIGMFGMANGGLNRTLADGSVSYPFLDGENYKKFALPLDGSVPVPGFIHFKKVDNGSARISKNHSETADYGLSLVDFDVNDNKVSMNIRASSNKVTFNDNANVSHTMLHTGISNAIVFTEDDTTAPSDTTALWAHL